jgi:hypothetical protein
MASAMRLHPLALLHLTSAATERLRAPLGGNPSTAIIGASHIPQRPTDGMATGVVRLPRRRATLRLHLWISQERSWLCPDDPTRWLRFAHASADRATLLVTTR